MEELKKELEKLSKAYVDTPENEEKILIPFVKRLLELPMKERRKLLPVIRDLQWIKSKFAGFSSETTCSAARAHFLSAVQFVCANKREMDMAYHVKFDMLCKLLPLYYPTWLMDFINDDKTWFNFNLNYEQLMQLMDMGYLKEIAPSRIAHVLPWITRIRNKEPKGNDTFNSELLLKRDITLKEHIWTIFEYESSIGYQDNCAKEAYKKGVTARDESISAALYRFSLDGHLDRERLLKATLATFHRSFKKDMAVCRILRNSATNYRRTVILARRDDANIHLFLYQTGERDVATVEKYCIRRRIPLSGIHRTCNHPFLLQPQKLAAYHLRPL